MYVVTSTRLDVAYPLSNLLPLLTTPSKSRFMAAKGLLQYIKATQDLTLFFPRSDASEITLEGYSASDYGNCLNTR
jgi:hypothetical protein